MDAPHPVVGLLDELRALATSAAMAPDTKARFAARVQATLLRYGAPHTAATVTTRIAYDGARGEATAEIAGLTPLQIRGAPDVPHAMRVTFTF